MIKMIRNVALLALGATMLAGCGDDSGKVGMTPTMPVPPPASAPAIQDRVGANFAAAFNTSNTAEPRDPSTADVPPLNLTAEPLDN